MLRRSQRKHALSVFLACFALTLLPALLCLAYARLVLPRPTAVVRRDDLGFKAFALLTQIVALPLLLLAVTWAGAVLVWVVCWSLPFALLRTRSVRESVALLRTLGGLGAPGTRGPSSAPETFPELSRHGMGWSLDDVVVACVGGVDRQGLLEFTKAWCGMLSFVPVLKYGVTANALLYDVREVYINQFTVGIDGNIDGDVPALDQPFVRTFLRVQVSDTILRLTAREDTDEWEFAGHHQCPFEPGKRPVIAGLQHMSSFTLVSHTGVSHSVQRSVIPPRSGDAAWLLLAVFLQAWNPWYTCAGYVEVNVRTDLGVEHPMWLYLDPSSRFHMQICENINELFRGVGKSLIAYMRDVREFGETPCFQVSVSEHRPR